ncbi:hypothetical protein BJY24_000092 [Nocardia transvalensis]|uniref:Uncharacterized protein n=1 Tax=Nocardia transvalensis TaxID=37333 RepID=A0A7W9P879_9NOCA|nr:hypothetical protein [Nocardia transvalensis]
MSEPLREPCDDEQGRRRDAGDGVGGRDADQQAAARGEGDGSDQRGPPSPPVGEPAERQAADRPDDETDGEDDQRR